MTMGLLRRLSSAGLLFGTLNNRVVVVDFIYSTLYVKTPLYPCMGVIRIFIICSTTLLGSIKTRIFSRNGMKTISWKLFEVNGSYH